MYPALIIAAVTILWDGYPVSHQPGDLVLLTAGGALESAIGLASIQNVSGDASTLAGAGAGISN